MKKKFLPYYLSRAAISAAFALLVMGLTLKAVLFAAALFGMFLLYLHSGWFHVDPSHPLTPLRRDDRGQQIQRKALIAAVCVGVLTYALMPVASRFLGAAGVSGSIALALGVATYFITQFALFARS
jgi:hypothetical protein